MRGCRQKEALRGLAPRSRRVAVILRSRGASIDTDHGRERYLH